MSDLIFCDVIKTPLLVEQHFHGAFGVDFSNCDKDGFLKVAKELIKRGIGAFFPTLVTDSVENIKRQIDVIKEAIKEQNPECAKILGIHLEGIFINPLKKGIHNEALFLEPTVENYKLIEDDLIKIVTLAPELDKDCSLRKYLKANGVKVQAGHCVGDNLSDCRGVTHLFNAMGGVSHRNTQTALSALVNDEIYTEVIADGIHLSDDILRLVFKSKPEDKVILISDALPIAGSDLAQLEFAGSTVYYDGKSAKSKDGTIAGSCLLLDDIVRVLAKKGLFNPKLIENTYKYHGLSPEGCVYWDEDYNIMAVEKDGVVLYKE